MTRRRLDDALVARGLYPSRARARDAILRGTVTVGDSIARKPAQTVDMDASITVADPASRYVSRAALKLVAALDHFGLSPEGCHCLDIGASTGGFTQVLLERGAKSVTAIDVGHDQFSPVLRSDKRVRLLEGLNARELSVAHLEHAPQFIVADVSFISLKLALPPALALAPPAARLIALVKPQFEAGRERVGKTGIVSDSQLHAAICGDMEAWLNGLGWPSIGVIASPIAGGDGNREFLIAAEKSI